MLTISKKRTKFPLASPQTIPIRIFRQQDPARLASQTHIVHKHRQVTR